MSQTKENRNLREKIKARDKTIQELHDEQIKLKEEIEKKSRLLSTYKSVVDVTNLTVIESRNNGMIITKQDHELRQRLEFCNKRIKEGLKAITSNLVDNDELKNTIQSLENDKVNANLIIKQLTALNEEKCMEIKQMQKKDAEQKLKVTNDYPYHSRYVSSLRHAILFGEYIAKTNKDFAKVRKLWLSNASIWLSQLGESKLQNANVLDNTENSDEETPASSTIKEPDSSEDKVEEAAENEESCKKKSDSLLSDKGLIFSPQLSVISQLSNASSSASDTRTTCSSDSGIDLANSPPVICSDKLLHKNKKIASHNLIIDDNDISLDNKTLQESNETLDINTPNVDALNEISKIDLTKNVLLKSIFDPDKNDESGDLVMSFLMESLNDSTDGTTPLIDKNILAEYQNDTQDTNNKSLSWNKNTVDFNSSNISSPVKTITVAEEPLLEKCNTNDSECNALGNVLPNLSEEIENVSLLNKTEINITDTSAHKVNKNILGFESLSDNSSSNDGSTLLDLEDAELEVLQCVENTKSSLVSTVKDPIEVVEIVSTSPSKQSTTDTVKTDIEQITYTVGEAINNAPAVSNKLIDVEVPCGLHSPKSTQNNDDNDSSELHWSKNEIIKKKDKYTENIHNAGLPDNAVKTNAMDDSAIHTVPCEPSMNSKPETSHVNKELTKLDFDKIISEVKHRTSLFGFRLVSPISNNFCPVKYAVHESGIVTRNTNDAQLNAKKSLQKDLTLQIENVEVNNTKSLENIDSDVVDNLSDDKNSNRSDTCSVDSIKDTICNDDSSDFEINFTTPNQEMTECSEDFSCDVEMEIDSCVEDNKVLQENSDVICEIAESVKIDINPIEKTPCEDTNSVVSNGITENKVIIGKELALENVKETSGKEMDSCVKSVQESTEIAIENSNTCDSSEKLSEKNSFSAVSNNITTIITTTNNSFKDAEDSSSNESKCAHNLHNYSVSSSDRKRIDEEEEELFKQLKEITSFSAFQLLSPITDTKRKFKSKQSKKLPKTTSNPLIDVNKTKNNICETSTVSTNAKFESQKQAVQICDSAEHEVLNRVLYDVSCPTPLSAMESDSNSSFKEIAQNGVKNFIDVKVNKDDTQISELHEIKDSKVDNEYDVNNKLQEINSKLREEIKDFCCNMTLKLTQHIDEVLTQFKPNMIQSTNILNTDCDKLQNSNTTPLNVSNTIDVANDCSSTLGSNNKLCVPTSIVPQTTVNLNLKSVDISSKSSQISCINKQSKKETNKSKSSVNKVSSGLKEHSVDKIESVVLNAIDLEQESKLTPNTRRRRKSIVPVQSTTDNPDTSFTSPTKDTRKCKKNMSKITDSCPTINQEMLDEVLPHVSCAVKVSNNCINKSNNCVNVNTTVLIQSNTENYPLPDTCFNSNGSSNVDEISKKDECESKTTSVQTRRSLRLQSIEKQTYTSTKKSNAVKRKEIKVNEIVQSVKSSPQTIESKRRKSCTDLSVEYENIESTSVPIVLDQVDTKGSARLRRISKRLSTKKCSSAKHENCSFCCNTITHSQNNIVESSVDKKVNDGHIPTSAINSNKPVEKKVEQECKEPILINDNSKVHNSCRPVKQISVKEFDCVDAEVCKTLVIDSAFNSGTVVEDEITDSGHIDNKLGNPLNDRETIFSEQSDSQVNDSLGKSEFNEKVSSDESPHNNTIFSLTDSSSVIQSNSNTHVLLNNSHRSFVELTTSLRKYNTKLDDKEIPQQIGPLQENKCIPDSEELKIEKNVTNVPNAYKTSLQCQTPTIGSLLSSDIINDILQQRKTNMKDSIQMSENFDSKPSDCKSVTDDIASKRDNNGNIPIFNFYTSNKSAENVGMKRKTLGAVGEDENSDCKKMRIDNQPPESRLKQALHNVGISEEGEVNVFCNNVILTAYHYHKDSLFDNSMDNKTGGTEIINDILSTITQLVGTSSPFTQEMLDETLVKLKQFDLQNVTTAISSILSKDDGCPVNNASPPLTPLQRYIFPVVYKLCKDPGLPNFFHLFLRAVKNILFCEVNKCLVEPSQLITRFTMILSRSLNAFDEMRTFLYDVLYMLRYKCIPIIHTMLLLWPGLMPKYEFSQDCPVLFCIGQILVNHKKVENKSIDLYCLQKVKRLLTHKYGYKVGHSTSETVFDKLLNMISKKGFVDAVVLLCKREGCEWTLNKLSKTFLPMLESYREGFTTGDVAVIVIIAIGHILRPFPNDVVGPLIHKVFCEFNKILSDTSGCPKVQKAVAISLCRLSRNNFNYSVNILHNWKPKDGEISENVVKSMKHFIAKRKPLYWLKLLAGSRKLLM